MIRLFFLELPLSMLIGGVGLYSSYIVTIGVTSSVLDYPSIFYWMSSAIVLVSILYFLNCSNYLYGKVVFKNFILKFLPSLGFAVGVLAQIAGLFQ